MLPGVVLFVAGVVGSFGFMWFDRRKQRPAKSWVTALLLLSIPYGLATWWIWSIDDDTLPWHVLGPMGLLVGFMAAHFLLDGTGR